MCFCAGNYRTQLYDKQKEEYLPATQGLGMFVEVRDPDDKVNATNKHKHKSNDDAGFLAAMVTRRREALPAFCAEHRSFLRALADQCDQLCGFRTSFSFASSPHSAGHCLDKLMQCDNIYFVQSCIPVSPKCCKDDGDSVHCAKVSPAHPKDSQQGYSLVLIASFAVSDQWVLTLSSQNVCPQQLGR